MFVISVGYYDQWATPDQWLLHTKLWYQAAAARGASIALGNPFSRCPAAIAGPAWQHGASWARQPACCSAARLEPRRERHASTAARRPPEPADDVSGGPTSCHLAPKNMASCMLCSASRPTATHRTGALKAPYHCRRSVRRVKRDAATRLRSLAAVQCCRPAAVVSVEARRRAGRTTTAVWRTERVAAALPAERAAALPTGRATTATARLRSAAGLFRRRRVRGRRLLSACYC